MVTTSQLMAGSFGMSLPLRPVVNLKRQIPRKVEKRMKLRTREKAIFTECCQAKIINIDD
jgi:hypothetical protein